MNVLVLGASGAGKSTLIKSISGIEVATGVGEGNTQKIEVYESKTWPLRFIDTKGFEYNFFKQLQTIHQIKKYTKQQTAEKDENEPGIDAVWYCVDGTVRRMFSDNIELMNKAIRGWKKVPVFAVLTKSYSEKDIPENIEVLQQVFAKSKSVNLKKIIPVVAEEYAINDDISVMPKGIEELCAQTLECADEAKAINKENRERMVLLQKRHTANVVTAGSAGSAAIVGAVPLNFADAIVLVPLETALVKGIFKVYKVNFSADLVSGIIGSAIITNIAKGILKALTGKIPVAGAVLNGVVAAIIVEALGQSVIAASEAIYKGIIDPAKIDQVTTFVGEKIKENKIVGTAISYLETNADKLKGKNAKDIFEAIKEIVENSIKNNEQKD